MVLMFRPHCLNQVSWEHFSVKNLTNYMTVISIPAANCREKVLVISWLTQWLLNTALQSKYAKTKVKDQTIHD